MIRNEACKRVERHYINSSPGLWEVFLPPGTWEKQHCKQYCVPKYDLVKLCSQVLPLHSCYVCSFIACEISPTSLISSSNFWVIEQAESEIFALVDASVINKSCLMLREKEENRFPLPKLYQCRISLLRNESQGTLHYTDWIQALSSSSRPVRV